MGSHEMSCLDLECGAECSSTDESICVLNATEGSCSSQSYSAADSSNQGHDSDSDSDQVPHSRRVSSVVATDCVVDIDVDEVRISAEMMERECRICMLSLDSESGVAIELGCCCKNELAAVHQHCAETWFTSKGNRICEICKSIAQNFVMPKSPKSSQQIFEVPIPIPIRVPEDNTFLTNTISVPVSGRNALSTNAASFQEVEVITVSRRSDLAPESSTPVTYRVWLILAICSFIGMGIYPIVGSFISTLLH